MTSARPYPSRAVDISHAELASRVGGAARIVLEVGCNDGTDTVGLLGAYRSAAVHCFDCEPRAIRKWKARLGVEPRDPTILAGGANRARLHEVALDAEPGTAVFWQSSGSPRPDVRDWDMSGSICRPTGHLDYSPWCKFNTTIKVPTTTLDDWAMAFLPAGTAVDLLWIDVQGAEGRVFRGGQRTLARTRWVKAEAHAGEMYEGQPTEAEMLALLPGFEVVGRFADDLLFRNARIA